MELVIEGPDATNVVGILCWSYLPQMLANSGLDEWISVGLGELLVCLVAGDFEVEGEVVLEFAQFGREGEEGSESSGYLDGSGFSLHLDINIEIISEDHFVLNIF